MKKGLNGRLMRHLYHRARLLDLSREQQRAERWYRAARQAQAVVRGIRCRRWMRTYRAARTIQRMYKHVLWWRGYLEDKRLTARPMITNYVTSVLAYCVNQRKDKILFRHYRLLAKAQARMRGFIVRKWMAYVKLVKKTYYEAVAVVQRFWRKKMAQANAREYVQVTGPPCLSTTIPVHIFFPFL